MPKYDVVIIGSGLGGLECAYILAKEGYSVCVLEKNRQYGGNLQIFSRDKAIFDTGVHYIGGLDEGQNLYQYFKYFGIMDKLKLKRMDENGFDKISFDNDPVEYNHSIGYDRFVENLLKQFPNEKEGLLKYTKKIKEVCDFFPLYNVKPGRPAEMDFQYMETNAKDFIESCTTNKKLQNVLAGSNVLYAGYPDKTPLYVHALVINTYIESAWRCIDGGGQIAKYLVSNIRKEGCVIRNYSEVTAFRFGSGKNIEAAELSTGELVEGKFFISNMHPSLTMEMVEPSKIRAAYRNRMTNLTNSISVFNIYATLKPNTFPYLNHNIYHYKYPDVWRSVYYDKKLWPECFCVFVPVSSKSTEYADTVNIMAYMHFEEVEQWANTQHTIPRNAGERGDGYEDFKKEKAEKLLDEVELRIPGLRSKINSYYTSTPLSFRDYIGTSDGSMYGVLKDHKSPLKSYITPRTKVPNLFLTGQNLNMHGLLGVTVSAVLTCSNFMESDYIIKKVKAAQ